MIDPRCQDFGVGKGTLREFRAHCCGTGFATDPKVSLGPFVWCFELRASGMATITLVTLHTSTYVLDSLDYWCDSGVCGVVAQWR